MYTVFVVAPDLSEKFHRQFVLCYRF